MDVGNAHLGTEPGRGLPPKTILAGQGIPADVNQLANTGVDQVPQEIVNGATFVANGVDAGWAGATGQPVPWPYHG